VNSLNAIRIAASILAFSALASCGVKGVDLNVVVFNYWPRAMADVYVDGQHVGAGFEEAGGRGSISCCHRVEPGKVKIEWMLGGALGDPLTGKTMTALTELSAIEPGARYLGVYLYPDGSAALDTAKGIPDDQFPRARK
jgi:hypothetical protein